MIVPGGAIFFRYQVHSVLYRSHHRDFCRLIVGEQFGAGEMAIHVGDGRPCASSKFVVNLADQRFKLLLETLVLRNRFPTWNSDLKERNLAVQVRRSAQQM